DLRELGHPRRAIDAIFREVPVYELPGFSRPFILAADYLALLDGCAYCDRCGARVRPCGKIPDALSKKAPGRGPRQRPRPDLTKTCKEVKIVMSKLPRPDRG